MTLASSFNRLHKLDGFALVLFPNEALVANMVKNLPMVDSFQQRNTIVVTASNDPCLPMDLFRRVRVISVSRKFKDSACSDESLIRAIRDGIKMQNEGFDIRRQPPAIDHEAAARVAAAFAALPPATEADRKAFLNEFYGGMGEGP